MEFKNIVKTATYGILLLLLIGGFFFVKDYFIQNKKYTEYKTKVEQTLKDNELLNQTIELNKKEKEKLLADLDKKEIEIVIKEKIVYKDGQLIIPDDYESLKSNYEVLDEMYTTKSEMYTKARDQNDKDTITIQDLQTENTRLSDLLENPVNPPITFFSQSLYGGLGIKQDNTYVFSAGYGVTLGEKIQVIALAQYPLSVSVLVGIKL